MPNVGICMLNFGFFFQKCRKLFAKHLKIDRNSFFVLNEPKRGKFVLLVVLCSELEKKNKKKLNQKRNMCDRQPTLKNDKQYM